MRLVLFALTLVASVPVQAVGQQHLPEQQIFHTPARMLLDGSVETPAAYSGVSVAPGVGTGQQVQFQVFVPRAAGELGFALRVHVEPRSGSQGAFEIAEVRDWGDRLLRPVAGSNRLTHADALARFDRIPGTGHVATVVLDPQSTSAFSEPVRVETWVTFVSDPPRRAWELRGERLLSWF